MKIAHFLNFIFLSLLPGCYFSAAFAPNYHPGFVASNSNPTLTAIILSPANASISLGENQQFSATGIYSDGSNQTITTAAVWSAVNGSASVTINRNNGLATSSGTTVGTVTITATLNAVVGSTTLHIGNYSQEIANVAGQFWIDIGLDGPATSAVLQNPVQIVLDAQGNQYIADSSNNVIRRVDALTGNITNVAGNGTYGYSGDGGAATNAEISSANGIAVDSSGNLFIADSNNSVVREVVAATGKIQTVAGNGTYGYSGDGAAATSATLSYLGGVAVDGSGNLFIADSNNNVIREVVAATGNIQTVAGNGSSGYSGNGFAATSAKLNNPNGIAVDSSGNLFIADTYNCAIREVVAATGNIETVAGVGAPGYSGDGGAATNAQLNYLYGITVDSSGNLFIADTDNFVIREVLAATGNIQTVAGDGIYGYSGDGSAATSGQLNYPRGVAVGGGGNLFISDSNNWVIREVIAATGKIKTVAGSGSSGFAGNGNAATSAQLNNPSDVVVDSSGNLFIADSLNNRIREVVASTGKIETVAGDGLSGNGGDGAAATSAQLNAPNAIAVDGSGNLFIADSSNFKVREVEAASGNIQTIAGNGNFGYRGDGAAATSARISLVRGIAVDRSGNVFIADSQNYAIREVVAASGIIQTVAGNGTPGYTGDGAAATNANLNGPSGIAVDGNGNLFIADSNAIREVVAATGIIQTIAGNVTSGYSGDGGPATNAKLNNPYAIALDASGNLFIADSANLVIREVIAATGDIETVAGNRTLGYSASGTAARSASFNSLGGLAVDSQGNLFIADMVNRVVQEIVH